MQAGVEHPVGAGFDEGQSPTEDECAVSIDAPGPGLPSDPQYVGLKGVWKDTLWIKPNYTVTIRTRYERYIGDFVLHCHILDHEDRGMMQNVAIVLPGQNAASVNAAPVGHNH